MNTNLDINKIIYEILDETLSKLYNAISELNVVKDNEDEISIEFDKEKLIELVESMFMENTKTEVDDIATITTNKAIYKICATADTSAAKTVNNNILIPLEVSYYGID